MDNSELRKSLTKQIIETTKNFGENTPKEENIKKKGNELVNVFWFNTQLSAKHCALIHCNNMIKELNHHSDLHGYYQDDNGYQSIIDRIEFYKNVITYIEERW